MEILASKREVIALFDVFVATIGPKLAIDMVASSKFSLPFWKKFREQTQLLHSPGMGSLLI